MDVLLCPSVGKVGFAEYFILTLALLNRGRYRLQPWSGIRIRPCLHPTKHLALGFVNCRLAIPFLGLLDLYYVVITSNHGMPPLSTLVETTVQRIILCNKCVTNLLGLVFVSHLSSWTTRGASVPKMISMPEVHSAQTVHLSCAETNTISKRTKTSFH
jgi:hypothetical protein